MFNDLFLQISILLGLTVSVAFVTRLLRQPLMVAYILAGIVAGPFMLNLLPGNTHLFEVLADFGVVLLLFVVGMSLNFQHIKRIGKVATIVGLVQILGTSALGFGILVYLGFSAYSALFLAVAASISSTIIVVKLLSDKQDLEAVYGRYTLGLMIVQDIFVVLIMILLSSLRTQGSLKTDLSLLVLKILSLGAFTYITAKYIVPYLLKEVAESTEFLFIFTIAWCFGIASLLHWLGFSIEIGGLIAGLALGSSPYQKEISSRIKPLRDFFIIIFFIILGSELTLTNIEEVIIPGIAISILVLVIKPFIIYHTYRLQGFTRRNSYLCSSTTAQVSEFGFILMFTANRMGLLKGSELEVFTLIALITIIVSSYVITYDERLYRVFLPVLKMFGEDKNSATETIPEKYDVWVFGYHRTGWKICDALEEKGVDYAVVDFNPEAIEKLQKRGIPAFYGDAADIEFIETLPLEEAEMVISTLPEPDDQEILIESIRKRSEDVKIIATLHHTRYLDRLYDAGANYVMLPHLLGGSFIAEEIKHHEWNKETFEKLRQEQKQDLKLEYTKPEEDNSEE
ncbi:MAG: cation:proton antiporter [Candidatus Magasanikbacteria bacterium]